MIWDVLIAGLVLLVYGRLVIMLERHMNKRRGMQYVKLLKMSFPDADVTYVSAEGTEGKALAELKRKMATGEDVKPR